MTPKMRMVQHALGAKDHGEHIEKATAEFASLVRRLGFYPRDSVLFTWFRSGTEVLVQRVDLGVDVDKHFNRWLESVFAPAKAYEPQEVRVSIVCSESWFNKVALIQMLEACLREKGIFVSAASSVCALELANDSVAHGVWTTECSQCCDDWHVATEFANDGANILRSREELRELFCYQVSMAINPEFIKKVMRVDVAAKDRWRTNQLRLIVKCFQGEAETTDLMAARMAYALSDVRVRDTILWDMASGCLESQIVFECLMGLIPRLTGAWVAGFICVAAVAAWLQGNGATANMCIDRALAEAPENNLANLLRVSLNNGISPQLWVESVLELSREECRYGVPLAQIP
jgi:hypothetical protein